MSSYQNNSSLNNWDPLEGQRINLDQEIYSATIKRQIKNILKSYTGWYDPLSEIIQNALDAIDNRLKDEIFDPKIWIQIDLKNNTLAVTDNGIGFSENQFRVFLAPNVSFKSQADNTRGNKGVGATYLGYGFNFLQIGTKTPDFSYLGSLRNGKNWVEDLNGLITRPVLSQEKEPIHNAFNEIDRGSTCLLKFVGDNIRPKNLKHVGANTAKQWAVVLRLKTPIGGIHIGQKQTKDKKNVLCEIEVVQENGDIDRVQLSGCDYLYPHEVISQCKNIAEIESAQKKLIEQGKAPTLPAPFHKLNGIYGFWDNKTINEKFIASDDEGKALSEQYQLTCYAFFCYSTSVWDTYSDETVGLRKGTRGCYGLL